MGRVVSCFTKRKFLTGVPIELLRRLFQPFATTLGIDVAAMTHEPLLAYLLDHSEELPDELIFKLHQISDLACPEGYELLIDISRERGTPIKPLEPDRDQSDLSQQELTVLAFLEYHSIFEAATERFQPMKLKGYAEFNGKEVVESDYDEAGEEAFEQALRSFFAERYKGHWCRIRRFEVGDTIQYLIQHGKHKSSYRIVEEDGPKDRLLREEKQDALIYYPHLGKVLVSAASIVEKREMAQMFSHHIIDRPDWLEHEDAENSYSLAPLQQVGVNFQFESEWDSDCVGVAVTEIQFADGVRGGQAVTFRASNVLDLLRRYPDFNPQTQKMTYIKLRFVFLWNGKKRTWPVTLRPPRSALFDRRLYGDRIIEHLRRNRFAV